MPDILNTVYLPVGKDIEDCFLFVFYEDLSVSVFRASISDIVSRAVSLGEGLLQVHIDDYGNGGHIPSTGLSHTALADKGSLSHTQIESWLSQDAMLIGDITSDLASHTQNTGNGYHLPLTGLSHGSLTGIAYGNGGHIPTSGLSHTALVDKGSYTHAQLDALCNPGTPQTPTLQGTWVNYGSPYSEASYRKNGNGSVYVSGVVKSGANNSIVFYLPIGYRPSGTILFAVPSGAGYSRVDINANGEVRLVGATSAFLSLELCFCV